MLFSLVEWKLRITYCFPEKVAPIITSLGLNEQTAGGIHRKKRKRRRGTKVSTPQTKFFGFFPGKKPEKLRLRSTDWLIASLSGT
jgi:hypothetical protein